MKEQLLEKLQKFGYKFEVKENVICINQEYSHNLYVHLL